MCDIHTASYEPLLNTVLSFSQGVPMSCLFILSADGCTLLVAVLAVAMQQPLRADVVSAVPITTAENHGSSAAAEAVMMDLSDNNDEVMAPADNESFAAFWEPAFMIKLCQEAFLCGSVDKQQQ